ncbi:MAG: glycoside hydrolase, partial [Sphingobacteriaceae bacterium]|nr:glycoside hydrolase [Sphingobacteriaceae bacterium]
MKKFLILSCLIATQFVMAQTSKRFYIANDDHTDYMWTGNEAQYDTAFVKMLDYYLHEIDLTKNNAPDFQARYNLDCSYWLDVYEKYRSGPQFNNLVAKMKSGHITTPLNLLVNTYGAQPTEAIIRGMYYSGKMERKLGMRFPLAICMENQTLPLGLSSLWAGSGAKYSWRGVCGCATRLTDKSLENRRNQLYYYKGMDSTGVMMKWYNRSIYNGRTLGGYAEARRNFNLDSAASDLEKVIADMDKLCGLHAPNPAYPYHVAGAFGYGHDNLETYQSPAFISVAQKLSTATRKIRVSNELDFFEDIEKTYPKLPSESVSYGNEWDIYCTSMNETTAKVRRSVEKLRSAEALASVVSLEKGDFADKLVPAKDKAWTALGMYWEHDWTADGPISQKARGDWQIKLQNQISGYTDSLYNLSILHLGKLIRKDKEQRFYVFNPLSWNRTGVADVAYQGPLPVKVVDVSTGKEVPSQVIHLAGKRYIRIEALSIPSVGYKVFEIQKGIAMKLPVAATMNSGYISNARYKIKLRKSGVITELYDRAANSRQLVQKKDGRYLNDLGTLNLDEGQPIEVENAGPVSVTFKAVSKLPVPHTVKVTLYANSDRIDIHDNIQANFKDVKTWAFTFNLNQHTTRHEELGAILTAKKETEGGNYASQNARYDWLTFNHFADMSEKNYGVTLSNIDCSFFRLGQSTADSLHSSSSQLNALAGGQVDPYAIVKKGRKDTVMLGIYNQFDHENFNYQFSIGAHNAAFDAVKAMKFSLEHQNPLSTGGVTGNQAASAESSFSLLNVDDKNVLLWSVKP